MNYISVKDTASKFKISERRVQKLCEANRITGCKMISNVWLIPENATKPSDDRISYLPENENVLSLSELCKTLSISLATGRNWIKLRKLSPEYTEKNTPFFRQEYVEHLKKEILNGCNETLKKRRNKKYVSGNEIYNSYVSDSCKNIGLVQELLSVASCKKISFSEEVIKYLIADCSIKLLLKKEELIINNPSHVLIDFLNKKIQLKERSLIEDLIDNKKEAVSFFQNNQELFTYDYTFEKNEDILGLIYISCKNIGSRKATGTYYTPTKIVKKLVDSLLLNDNSVVLDPCCGTGNFLLQLPDNTRFENIYGNDIDSISVKIARINMALKFPKISVGEIEKHITEQNFLTENKNTNITHIIGNPPWGYIFEETDKTDLRKRFKCASTTNIESYDVFIEQSLSLLAKKGEVSFVLPEALLNVKAHSSIREIILNQTNIKEIVYLGNVFSGVQCPCIILRLEKTMKKLSTIGTVISYKNTKFTTHLEREISPDFFCFTTTDSEYSIVRKIRNTPNCSYLEGHADFALGIVTGNNKKYISTEKKLENEIVLKGSDIKKYRIIPSNNYILFKPENFQQVAPIQMYRAKEKLLYKFISNQLTFAYDNRQTLSLNSCNILIPKFDNIDIKYIMAVLNSRIAQFLFKKEFNSIKVLRSHIESIPIPIISKEKQNYIITITDTLSKETNTETILSLYNKLDSVISSLFDLSDEEQSVIKKVVDEDNLFLI